MTRNIYIMILGICLVSCTQTAMLKTPASTSSVDTLLVVPDQTVLKSELFYNTKKSLWTLNDQVYSGYAVRYYSDSIQLKEKFGILAGKKQNQSVLWHPDGHYKRIAGYHKGKLHGESKTWTADSLHVLVSHLHYVSGKVHGEQKKWYPTGELFKKLNFKMGKEEGLQQGFRKNGILFANYQAQEGRVFGLKKASLCFSIADEVVQYAKE